MTSLEPDRLAVPRILAVVVAIATAFGAVLADLVVPAGAAQHLHNDAWPPHAKFHDAQYIAMTVLLSAIAVALLLRRNARSRADLRLACAILSTPWLALLSAPLFPGTAVHDPEFDNPAVLGLHPQVFMAVVLLILLLIAVILGTRVGAKPAGPAAGR
ncbi:DUF6640 family protein [Nocardia sp. NPDC057668]|uniref:DUF6640 family protein n=1 Tax=Nocardia sp. NPDC057668 TaxID=3346202 RepID=UPI00366B154B